jgi:hypothetical protein
VCKRFTVCIWKVRKFQPSFTVLYQSRLALVRFFRRKRLHSPTNSPTKGNNSGIYPITIPPGKPRARRFFCWPKLSADASTPLFLRVRIQRRYTIEHPVLSWCISCSLSIWDAEIGIFSTGQIQKLPPWFAVLSNHQVLNLSLFPNDRVRYLRPTLLPERARYVLTAPSPYGRCHNFVTSL